MRRIHAVQRLRANFAGRSSWVRRALAPVLTRMPAERRFGAELVSERQVIRRAANDATFALEVQRTRLRAALLAAREADFYDIGEVDDPYATLKRLPVLTKHEVRAHSDRLLVKPPQTLDLVTTSGSSGEPAAFYLEKGRSAFEWAYVEHAWSRAGFDLDQWRAMLRGVSIAGADTRPWSAEPAFRELRLSPFHMSASNLDTYCDEIARRGIRFLHGYPSSLVPLAKHVLEQNLSALAGAVVGVFPVSEALEHWQTRLLQRAFPRAVLIPTYGLSERVAMAVATSDSIYEFYPTYGYVELVDGDGRQIRQAGGAGRIVATGFRNLGQPLLRYDTGDTAELVEAPSVGNGMVLKVCRIAPKRHQEVLYRADGSPVSTSALNLHSDAYLNVKKFRFRQTKYGEAELLLLQSPELQDRDIQAFVKELNRQTGGGLEFRAKVVESLAVTENGKERLVEQLCESP